MSKRLSGINPLSYLGVEPYVPPAMYQNGRNPTVTDSVGYNLGDFWLVVPPGYSGPELLFVLISLNMGQATWVQLYPNSGTSLEFETDSGTVNPLAGVVNVFGDGVRINTTGSGNTITIHADADVATDYVTDDGTATPSSNTLNVNGGVNINTSGSSNTILVSLDDNVVLAGTLAVNGSTSLHGNVFITSFHEGVVQSDNSGFLSSTTGSDGQIIIGATAAAPAWANITSLGNTVSITNGANTINLEVGAASGGVIVSQFTSSDTWTKNVSTQYVEVYGVCGGGGGASGAVSGLSAPTVFLGDGGGGGGTWGSFYIEGPAFMFASSHSITVGAGGTGGAAITASGATVGNFGGDGGASEFGDITVPVAITPGTLRSGGGQISPATSNPAGYYGQYFSDRTRINNTGTGTNFLGYGGGFPNLPTGINGQVGISRGNSPQSNFNSTYNYGSYLFGCGGGGGAGTTQAFPTTTNSGGDGGSVLSIVTGLPIVDGGAGGTAITMQDGGNGSAGNIAVGVFNCGGGGGGGRSQGSGARGGNGGDGGFPGGAGGGGGASNTTYPATSGAGGDGAPGIVIVIEYL